MAKTFKVMILTPSKVVLEEDVEKIFTSTVDGSIEFLPGHAATILSTVPCITRVYDATGNKKELFTSKGIINFSNNSMSFCCDAAEFPEEVDLSRAEAAKERAEAKIKDYSKFDVKRAEAALARANMRIELKKHSL